MKAMGFSKTVVTGVALNSDSTSANYGKLTVTKNTGQNGADQSSTIDLPSIYAKKNDVLYITSAPSSANTTGQVKIVVLSSEPSSKKNGYIYLITG